MAVRFEGFIPYGEVGVISMRRDMKQVIEPGAFRKSLEDGADVFLLNGRDYDHTIATVGSGTLLITENDEGVSFKTKGTLADTEAARDAATRTKAGLMQGVVPGFVAGKTKETADGVEVVLEAMLCETYLVGRRAFPSSRVSSFGRGFRRY